MCQLVRGEPSGTGQSRWDPYAGVVDRALIEDAGAVVNLAGAPIAHWPWTESYKRQILDSRVATTGTLATAIAESDAKPALVNASGVGLYGDRGDERLDEGSGPGDTFLASVVEKWEAATAPARDAGARVALARTSPVLDKSGGALKVMRLPFLLGVGGRIGSGKQWFASISLADYVAASMRLIEDDTLQGAFNLVAPGEATNAEFTRELGRALHRPTLIPVPAFAMKAVAGELSGEVLGSLRVAPARLLEAGFSFEHPTVREQLAAALADH